MIPVGFLLLNHVPTSTQPPSKGCPQTVPLPARNFQQLRGSDAQNSPTVPKV